MTQQEMRDQFVKLTERMISIFEAKNADYAAGDDPFKNLRRHGEHGIVVRMDDKISRLDSFFNPANGKKEAAVPEESIEDTALDLANYALLLIQVHRELHPAPIIAPRHIFVREDE